MDGEKTSVLRSQAVLLEKGAGARMQMGDEDVRRKSVHALNSKTTETNEMTINE